MISNRIEILSIDLNNQCHKECPFCYNSSNSKGSGGWKANEVIAFAEDCIKNGVRCVSLGGGEPFEHPEIFDIITGLYPLAYLTLTTNGLSLMDETIKVRLQSTRPDKIHISIHNPENREEVRRIMNQIVWLESIDVKAGVNLLVTNNNVISAQEVYRKLRLILPSEKIIVIPMRFHNTPTPEALLEVVDNHPFQSVSCLIKCRKPENFISVTWDKKVGWCSFSKSKKELKELSYRGLLDALELLEFVGCE